MASAYVISAQRRSSGAQQQRSIILSVKAKYNDRRRNAWPQSNSKHQQQSVWLVSSMAAAVTPSPPMPSPAPHRSPTTTSLGGHRPLTPSGRWVVRWVGWWLVRWWYVKHLWWRSSAMGDVAHGDYQAWPIMRHLISVMCSSIGSALS